MLTLLRTKAMFLCFDWHLLMTVNRVSHRVSNNFYPGLLIVDWSFRWTRCLFPFEFGLQQYTVFQVYCSMKTDGYIMVCICLTTVLIFTVLVICIYISNLDHVSCLSGEHVLWNIIWCLFKQNRQTSVCIPLRVIVTDRIIMMMILLLTLTISCCCLPIWVKTASPTAPFLPGLAIFPVEINSQCVKTQGYIHSGPLGHESVVLFSFKLAHIFQVSKSVYWMKTSHAY